jgi:hypothetical protein
MSICWFVSYFERHNYRFLFPEEDCIRDIHMVLVYVLEQMSVRLRDGGDRFKPYPVT